MNFSKKKKSHIWYSSGMASRGIYAYFLSMYGIGWDHLVIMISGTGISRALCTISLCAAIIGGIKLKTTASWCVDFAVEILLAHDHWSP